MYSAPHVSLTGRDIWAMQKNARVAQKLAAPAKLSARLRFMSELCWLLCKYPLLPLLKNDKFSVRTVLVFLYIEQMGHAEVCIEKIAPDVGDEKRKRA